jgi:hypothetical protein
MKDAVFSVGDLIVRSSILEAGLIVADSKTTSGIWMYTVRWRDSGREQRLPAEELRKWDKSPVPPPAAKTLPWKQPIEYLRACRNAVEVDRIKHREDKKLATRQLAEDLAKLPFNQSGRPKSSANNKAKKLIGKFERNIFPSNMVRKPIKENFLVDRWSPHPITQEDYEWLRRTVKGWTAKKFAYHGMHYPPAKGWRKRILKDWERDKRINPGIKLTEANSGKHAYAQATAMSKRMDRQLADRISRDRS